MNISPPKLFFRVFLRDFLVKKQEKRCSRFSCTSLGRRSSKRKSFVSMPNGPLLFRLVRKRAERPTEKHCLCFSTSCSRFSCTSFTASGKQTPSVSARFLSSRKGYRKTPIVFFEIRFGFFLQVVEQTKPEKKGLRLDAQQTASVSARFLTSRKGNRKLLCCDFR